MFKIQKLTESQIGSLEDQDDEVGANDLDLSGKNVALSAQIITDNFVFDGTEAAPNPDTVIEVNDQGDPELKWIPKDFYPSNVNFFLGRNETTREICPDFLGSIKLAGPYNYHKDALEDPKTPLRKQIMEEVVLKSLIYVSKNLI